jgi:pimeloyl-ACP methyl ester carboxylesterase
MKKMLINIIRVLLALSILVAVLLYFLQERLIFFPERLSAGFSFRFDQPFEEINLRTADNVTLNALLFKSASPRGVIFYLHGNAGSLSSWGAVAAVYTSLSYDVFMLDYRGYGKSGGSIHSELQFYQDVQLAYDAVKARYPENKIVVLGYSVGTGAAAWTAAVNHPRLLILQAPYFNFRDLVRHISPVSPLFLLKYSFETSKYLTHCRMPVVIFHGTKDEVIYYGSSLKLQALLKPGDRLITLDGAGHNGMSDNPRYLEAIDSLLSGP